MTYVDRDGERRGPVQGRLTDAAAEGTLLYLNLPVVPGGGGTAESEPRRAPSWMRRTGAAEIDNWNPRHQNEVHAPDLQ
jgi:hypothetical protein